MNILQPKNRKYRNAHRGAYKRAVNSHTSRISFGCYGLKSLETDYLKASQIEAVRRVIIRKVRKIGKIWIRVFPYQPITKKPTKTRMGKGKGSVQFWVCPIKRGQILFELGGSMPPETAKEIFKQAGQKLPFKTKFVSHERV